MAVRVLDWWRRWRFGSVGACAKRLASLARRGLGGTVRMVVWAVCRQHVNAGRPPRACCFRRLADLGFRLATRPECDFVVWTGAALRASSVSPVSA